MNIWYAPPVTTADVIRHWRKGANDALEAAELLKNDGKYDLALFHCHLAIEKALKAAIMEKTQKPHPKIHSLLNLATMLRNDWNTEDRNLFSTLSDFAVASRYDDPAWSERFATEENAQQWISRTEAFLSDFLV